MEKKTFLKPLKVMVVIFASLLALTIIVSSLVSVFYEKALVRYMKNYLDSHLLTQISMDDIHFRILKGFPNATIEIKNVTVLSGDQFSAKSFHESYADTLLQANQVFLQFNLFKMLQKQYELKKIEITDGSINILFDNKNRNNLNVWKTQEKSGNDYAVNLKNIVISNSLIRVISAKQHLVIKGWSDKTTFKGGLKSKVLSGTAKADLIIYDISVNNTRYINTAKTQLITDLIYTNDHYRFSQGSIKLNKADADFKGEYTGGRSSSMDLTLSMSQFGLEQIFSLLPFTSRFNQGDYTFSGTGKMNLIIKGSFSDPNNFLVKSDFNMANCTAKNINTKESLNHVKLRGTISGTNRKNFRLKVDTLQAEMGKGHIRANFLLRDLNRMLFETSVIANVDLKSLKQFISLDTLETLEGICRSDFIASGSFIHGDSSFYLLNYLKQGNFGLSDVSVKLKNLPVEFSKMTGSAYWRENLHLDSLHMILNETSLEVTGDIYNLSGYLMNKTILKASLSIRTDILNITKYLNHPESSGTGTGYKSLSIIPDHVNLIADIVAAEFVAGKFKSTDLRVKLNALKDSINLNNFSHKFPSGSINGSGWLTIDRLHNFSITCNAQPHNINIQELFYAFNNFTQHFIIDKNIRGYLGGTVNFYAQWDSAFTFKPSSMKAKGDFQINDGELVQFEPMLKLSKYIDVEELKHIRFKTLKNTIFISDRIVNIPEMAINSSAFNILVSGHHSFDNQFDYRMKVLLSEVLFNKARKKKKEMDEFFIEESMEDQTTIPLIIAGTPDNFDVRFDRKKAFGLTRNKMKNIENQISPSDNKVKIEWDDEKPTEQKKSETNNKDSDIKVEWDD